MTNLRLRFEQWLTKTARPMNMDEADELFYIFKDFLDKEVCTKCDKLGYERGYIDGKEHGYNNGFEMGYDSFLETHPSRET